MLYVALCLLLCASVAANVYFFYWKKQYVTSVREIAHDLGNACSILQTSALCEEKGDLLHKQASFSILLCRELSTLGQRRQRRLEDAVLSLQETCKRMDAWLRSQQIELEFESMGNCLARIDHLSMERLLQNLLTNAAEAMESGGKILVQVDGREDRHITLSVQDTGKGMTKAELDRMFRTCYTTKSDRIGHGLGLSSSMRMAKLHGGALHAKSESGKGTCVYFRFAR